MRKTQHGAFSSKRYICSFGRLLLLIDHGMTDISKMSRLLSQSERLTHEYWELFEQHRQGAKWPNVYVELLEQLKAFYPSKKSPREQKPEDTITKYMQQYHETHDDVLPRKG